MLDGPYNSNDTLMLRAETGPGRNLIYVLLLAAAAVASGGLAALKDERAEFDDSRTTRTRNWIGWAKRVRRTSPLLEILSAARWSTVRAAIFQASVSDPGDAETDERKRDEYEPSDHGSAEHEPGDGESRADSSDNVVRCFQNHDDAISIATLDDDYLTCDCCGVAWTKCSLVFYRCQKFSMGLCAECEERRVNY